MTVEDLIEMLNKYPKDMEVVIQNRDCGWLYSGYDDEFCFNVEDDKLVL